MSAKRTFQNTRRLTSETLTIVSPALRDCGISLKVTKWSTNLTSPYLSKTGARKRSYSCSKASKGISFSNEDMVLETGTKSQSTSAQTKPRRRSNVTMRMSISLMRISYPYCFFNLRLTGSCSASDRRKLCALIHQRFSKMKSADQDAASGNLSPLQLVALEALCQLPATRTQSSTRARPHK